MNFRKGDDLNLKKMFFRKEGGNCNMRSRNLKSKLIAMIVVIAMALTMMPAMVVADNDPMSCCPSDLPNYDLPSCCEELTELPADCCVTDLEDMELPMQVAASDSIVNFSGVVGEIVGAAPPTPQFHILAPNVAINRITAPEIVTNFYGDWKILLHTRTAATGWSVDNTAGSRDFFRPTGTVGTGTANVNQAVGHFDVIGVSSTNRGIIGRVAFTALRGPAPITDVAISAAHTFPAIPMGTQSSASVMRQVNAPQNSVLLEPPRPGVFGIEWAPPAPGWPARPPGAWGVPLPMNTHTVPRPGCPSYCGMETCGCGWGCPCWENDVYTRRPDFVFDVANSMLGVGTHTETIRIFDTTANIYRTQTLTINVTATARSFSTVPSMPDFGEIAYGGEIPDSQLVILTNTGTESIFFAPLPVVPGWTLTPFGAWNAQLLSGAQRAVMVQPNADIGAGVHRPAIPFTTTDGLVANIFPRFTVRETAVRNFSITSTSPDLIFDGSLPWYEFNESQSFGIINNGERNVILGEIPVVDGWLLETDAVTWGRPLAPGDYRTITVRTARPLEPGDHAPYIRIETIHGEYTIINEDSGPTPTFRITASPIAPVFEEMMEGFESEAQTITVTAAGTDTGSITLNALPTVEGWTLEPASNWLTEMYVGDTRTFTLRPNAGLPAGTHTPTITITGVGGHGTPTATVNPTFTVTAIAGTYIYWGWYPQTHLGQGNAGEPLPEWGEEGVDFRRVVIGEYANWPSAGNSVGNAEARPVHAPYLAEQTHFFRYDPIRWRVLRYDGANHQLLVISENILDYAQFHQPGGTINFAGGWSASTLRYWMNNEFFNDAFSATEQAAIRDTINVGNSENQAGPNMTDRVFAISSAEMTVAFQMDTNARRVANVTPFANARGAQASVTNANAFTAPGAGSWWLRTPGTAASNMATVGTNGALANNTVANVITHSARPALNLNFNQDGILFERPTERPPEGGDTYTISASPVNVGFGSLGEGYAQPDAQTVTVTNTGTGNVTLNALPTVANWTLVAGANWATEMAPGATRTFTIRPNAGLGVGTYNPTVVITGNDGATATILPTFTVTEFVPITTNPPGAPVLTVNSLRHNAFSVDAIASPNATNWRTEFRLYAANGTTVVRDWDASANFSGLTAETTYRVVARFFALNAQHVTATGTAYLSVTTDETPAVGTGPAIDMPRTTFVGGADAFGQFEFWNSWIGAGGWQRVIIALEDDYAGATPNWTPSVTGATGQYWFWSPELNAFDGLVQGGPANIGALLAATNWYVATPDVIELYGVYGPESNSEWGRTPFQDVLWLFNIDGWTGEAESAFSPRAALSLSVFSGGFDDITLACVLGAFDYNGWIGAAEDPDFVLPFVLAHR